MYKNFFFDCDGVILDSNNIKTNGFYEACNAFGHDCAMQIVNYHKENGGISRYKKFKYFIKNILEYPFTDELYQKLLYKYSVSVSSQLLECKIAEKINFYRDLFDSSNWYIISGGDQKELRELFKKRSIDKYFNGGIFGSPKNKYQIFEDLFSHIKDKDSCIYLGDSLYDFEVASFFRIDFRYINEWSEFKNLKIHAEENNIKIHKNLSSFFGDIQGAFPESHNP